MLDDYVFTLAKARSPEVHEKQVGVSADLLLKLAHDHINILGVGEETCVLYNKDEVGHFLSPSDLH